MNQLDNPQKTGIDLSTRPTGVKWGVYAGLAAIFIGLIMYLTGSIFPDPEKGSTISSLLSFGSLILTCVLIVMGLNEYKKQANYLEIGDCVTFGFWYGLVSGAFSVVWTLVLTNLLEPDYYAKMAQSLMQMYEKMGLSEEQMTQALDNPMSKMALSPTSSLLMLLIGGPIFSILIAVIAGLFIKKAKKSYA